MTGDASERPEAELPPETGEGPVPAPDPYIGRGLFDRTSGALPHLYRGEIHRMKAWRERLDRTTYWAVTVLAAVLTWTFSSPDNPHYVLLAGGVLLGFFLVTESRRYRGYDMWRSRVRLLQENVFAQALDPREALEHTDWRERLAADYRSPDPRITFEEALAHRLRRIYLPLFTVLFAAWAFRVTGFMPGGWPETASVGVVPGPVVTAIVLCTYLGFLLVTVRPRSWQAKGELRSDDVEPWE
ncbi:DUF2270 domain-containing protein [Natronomonas sp. EA1]|uniref:DUF2270 domain-containing protein n=1 Tax=Natronomonas sp. EA1 TaxID=3421655 RepID=UPI003EB7CEFB